MLTNDHLSGVCFSRLFLKAFKAVGNFEARDCEIGMEAES